MSETPNNKWNREPAFAEVLTKLADVYLKVIKIDVLRRMNKAKKLNELLTKENTK